MRLNQLSLNKKYDIGKNYKEKNRMKVYFKSPKKKYYTELSMKTFVPQETD